MQIRIQGPFLCRNNVVQRKKCRYSTVSRHVPDSSANKQPIFLPVHGWKLPCCLYLPTCLLLYSFCPCGSIELESSSLCVHSEYCCCCWVKRSQVYEAFCAFLPRQEIACNSAGPEQQHFARPHR